MSRPAYPAAQRQNVVDDVHGHRVADPYRWLEEPHSDETKLWLDAQADLFQQAAEEFPGRARLRERISELLGAGNIGSPRWRGKTRFFMRRTAAQEHAVLYMVEPDGTERTLLD